MQHSLFAFLDSFPMFKPEKHSRLQQTSGRVWEKGITRLQKIVNIDAQMSTRSAEPCCRASKSWKSVALDVRIIQFQNPFFSLV